MEQELAIGDTQYAAVRREFEFRIDGDRPILYPLDYVNTHIHFLTPIQGFALSLLDGRTPFSGLKQLFSAVFPNSAPGTFQTILLRIDEIVRSHVSQTGLGAEGILEVADSPIPHARRFDPREFVVSPSDYRRVMEGTKTRFRLTAPINLYTVTTHRCHTDCLYCYADRRKVREMPLSRWRELIEEAADLGVRLCSPDNGETFARKDGVDFIECLIENRMHFLLSTKAHLSRPVIKRLMDAGFAEKVNGVVSRPVQLSFDAVDEDVSLRLLNVRKPRMEKTVETFETFLSFGIMPIIKAVITGLNYDQPKKIVDYFYPIGARRFSFIRYTRSFHRHVDDLFVRERHYPALAAQFAEIRSRYPDIEINENLSAFPAPLETLTDEQKKHIWDQRIGCGGGWHALGIGPDGKAFLCEQMAYEAPYFVGDATRQSIREIWDGQPMFDFIHPERDQFRETICGTCDEFETCMWEKGRCYRDAYFAYGSVFTPPPMCPSNNQPGLKLS